MYYMGSWVIEYGVAEHQKTRRREESFWGGNSFYYCIWTKYDREKKRQLEDDEVEAFGGNPVVFLLFDKCTDANHVL